VKRRRFQPVSGRGSQWRGRHTPGVRQAVPGRFYITFEHFNARFSADETILSVLLILAVFNQLGHAVYAADYGGTRPESA